jgi:hypothetical protein
MCSFFCEWNTGFIGHDVVNEMAGTLWFDFSDVFGPSMLKTRVVALTSKIKVIDDITRALKGLVNHIIFDNALYYQ